MKKIKIIGAGSIGNHFANAAKKLKLMVDVFDKDPKALIRMKNLIYPERYGKWDDSINILEVNNKNFYDLIIIGTPPDTHLEIAMNELKTEPKAMLIEKPLTTPIFKNYKSFFARVNESNTRFFCGYDHVLGEAAQKIGEIYKKYSFGKLITIDVEFREHWQGIFDAHSWLDGPKDTYLGFTSRGGGAIGEHSHAINFWQFLARTFNGGKIREVSAKLDIVNDKFVNYDKLALINVSTDKNILGRVIQDVVTKPSKKWARAQFENGFIEWHCGREKNLDEIIYSSNDNVHKRIKFNKSRADDFIIELKHISNCIKNKSIKSEISLDYGLDTMRVINGSILSHKEKRTIEIQNKNINF